MNKFRIFLSSPGDCADERKAVHDIAARLNADPLVNTFTHIEVIAWDQGEGIPLELLASPQSSVNKHLSPPEECDLFLGIFHCRPVNSGNGMAALFRQAASTNSIVPGKPGGVAPHDRKC